MANNNNVYKNLLANNSNAKVYFLDGQLGTPKGDSSLQTILSSLPKPASKVYESGVLPQVATLPPANLPSHYGHALNQLPRVVLTQGNVGIQATPGVPVSQVTQSTTQNEKSVGVGTNTGCITYPNAANKVIQITPGQRAQYVPIVTPNGVQGWYPAMQVIRNPQGPIIRTTDEIKYPKVDMDFQTNSATTETEAIEKRQVVKTQAVRNNSNASSNFGDIRTIGAILTLIGSLTQGLGIAGVVLYHVGKGFNSGLTWCYNAHSYANSLTQAVNGSSPGINYVTSGAGILGILTFIVGVMTMNLEDIQGPLPNATMWMSIINIPILVLMAIFSLLCFVMTFRSDGQSPTCVPLTVTSCLVIVMGAIVFTLTFVIYCKMQAHYYGQRTPGNYQSQEPPLRKISVVKVNASATGGPMIRPCTCECCPCCMPSSAFCCPECMPYNNVREGYDNDDNNVKIVDQNVTPTPVVVAGSNEAPILKYPYPNSQYIWGQMTPYGHFNRPAVYAPYNYRMQTK